MLPAGRHAVPARGSPGRLRGLAVAAGCAALAAAPAAAAPPAARGDADLARLAAAVRARLDDAAASHVARLVPPTPV
ncbi:MAG TPA: hypothetical protein VK601_14775, partial [Kofleriaceae bacterium]|nr:hypothetical protein [Kofleriaceae bacterium]